MTVIPHLPCSASVCRVEAPHAIGELSGGKSQDLGVDAYLVNFECELPVIKRILYMGPLLCINPFVLPHINAVELKTLPVRHHTNKRPPRVDAHDQTTYHDGKDVSGSRKPWHWKLPLRAPLASTPSKAAPTPVA